MPSRTSSQVGVFQRVDGDWRADVEKKSYRNGSVWSLSGYAVAMMPAPRDAASRRGWSLADPGQASRWHRYSRPASCSQPGGLQSIVVDGGGREPGSTVWSPFVVGETPTADRTLKSRTARFRATPVVLRRTRDRAACSRASCRTCRARRWQDTADDHVVVLSADVAADHRHRAIPSHRGSTVFTGGWYHSGASRSWGPHSR